MRIFTLLIVLFFQISVFAKPTAPVTHAHNGRIHTHPLPLIGISHRHGTGLPGVRIGITSSIQNQPREKKNTQIIKQSSFKPSATTNFTRTVSNCKSGDVDCNVCAVNVRQQFQRAAGNINWKSQPWYFNWNHSYLPNGVRPLDTFDGAPVYALGIPDKHIQGFVRTYSSTFPYAGSHSHKRNGSIFILAATKNGLQLSSLIQTKSPHPSAVHVLGDYLTYGDGHDLVFLNINNPIQRTMRKIQLPRAAFGGGIGLVKLSSDNFLVISTAPGGQKSGKRYHYFHHLIMANGNPESIRFINRADSTIPGNWPNAFQFSENLSVISECGSGDIYTIHTTGDEKGVSMIRGNGYWRLSQLESVNGKLQLNPISGFSSRQNMKSCNLRSSATVFVDNNNTLKFYCHAYAKDPDGSLFNVLGSSSRNNDKFYFKTGTL